MAPFLLFRINDKSFKLQNRAKSDAYNRAIQPQKKVKQQTT